MIAAVRFTTIELSRRASVAELRLARPDAGNPVDARLLDELEQATAEIHDDPSVHVVLLGADGPVFSAGGGPRTADGALPFCCLERMAQPVVACLQGDAMGAGLELALACDVRIAARGARFGWAGVATGAMPALGGTQRLPRLIGRARATELLLLGEPIEADHALAWGLVNHVAPDPAAALAEAQRLCATIAARGPLAVRYAKEAISRGLDMPLDQALRYETDLTVILQTTADRSEGVKAFLEKRPPRFPGR